jgi:hypothetical protein
MLECGDERSELSHMTDRKKPGAAFWVTVVVVAVLVAYPLSLGPMFWGAFHFNSDLGRWRLLHTAYKPIVVIGRRNRCAKLAINWYLDLGVPTRKSYFNETVVGYADR